MVKHYWLKNNGETEEIDSDMYFRLNRSKKKYMSVRLFDTGEGYISSGRNSIYLRRGDNTRLCKVLSNNKPLCPGCNDPLVKVLSNEFGIVWVCKNSEVSKAFREKIELEQLEKEFIKEPIPKHHHKNCIIGYTFVTCYSPSLCECDRKECEKEKRR